MGIIARGGETMQGVLEDLLPEAVAEAARQLREMARDDGLEIRVADHIPRVEVDAAAALAHGLTLATANVRQLGRVAGLQVEDWSR